MESELPFGLLAIFHLASLMDSQASTSSALRRSRTSSGVWPMRHSAASWRPSENVSTHHMFYGGPSLRATILSCLALQSSERITTAPKVAPHVSEQAIREEADWRTVGRPERGQ